MQNTAKLQMDTALKLAAELGLMTQIYNNRLAQLLRGHDVTYPQYVILNHILSCGPKRSINQSNCRRCRGFATCCHENCQKIHSCELCSNSRR